MMRDRQGQSTERLVVDGVGIALGDRGILLLGASGSGRSDLALQMIDRGALLVADEQVEIFRRAGDLWLRPPSVLPAHLHGRIEARGIGLLRVPATPDPVRLAWVAEIRPGAEIERMPAPPPRRFLGCDIPVLQLSAFEASAPAKLRLALANGPGLIMGRDEP